MTVLQLAVQGSVICLASSIPDVGIVGVSLLGATLVRLHDE